MPIFFPNFFFVCTPPWCPKMPPPPQKKNIYMFIRKIFVNNSQIKQVFGIKEINITLFWAIKCNVAWRGISGGANFISYQSLNCHLPPWVKVHLPSNFGYFYLLKLTWFIDCMKVWETFLPQTQDLASPSMLHGSSLSLRNFPSPNLRYCFHKYEHWSSLWLRNFPSPN